VLEYFGHFNTWLSKKLIKFEIIILEEKKGGIVFKIHYFLSQNFFFIGKEISFWNFNIFENNISSVEAAKVVVLECFPSPISYDSHLGSCAMWGWGGHGFKLGCFFSPGNRQIWRIKLGMTREVVRQKKRQG